MTSKPTRPDSPAPPLLTRRRLLTVAAASAAGCVGVGAWAHWVEPEQIVTREVDLRIDGWPRSADGLRLGVMSDLHVDCERAAARARRAADVLAAARPDVVLLAGDFITTKPSRWSSTCAGALSRLAGVRGGAFAVLGNHDFWGGDPARVARDLSAAGIRVLRNQSAPVARGAAVWVVGVDDRIARRSRPTQALRGVPAHAARVLLVHEPDYADEAPRGFAFQVSGHSHGGQVRLPGVGALHLPKYGRKYPLGWQQARHHGVYTTSGVGVIGPCVRLGVPSEVVVLEVRGQR